MTGELIEAVQPIARAEAFRRLADRHLDAAYGLARAILRDPSEAEDATHDAFETAWRKWGSLRDVGRFEHWFDRILVNTCRNRLRRGARWQIREIDPELGLEETDPYGSTVDRDLLGQAIGRLGPDLRIVIALRYYRDLTVDEIAARVGVPSGTVKSRLHYALRALHSMLDQSDAREVLR